MVAGRPSRCFTVVAAPGQHRCGVQGAVLGQARHWGRAHETIGVDRARLRPVAACGDSHVSCRRSGPHERRLGRTRPGDLSQPVAFGRPEDRARSGTRIPKRSWISSGSRQPAPIRASPPTARSPARAGWSGGCAARRATTRRPSTASMPARCATAGRTATAVSRSAPAKFSTATGRTACSKARASMSTPRATATRACSRQASPNGEGRCSPAPARYSKASSATA